MLLVNPQTRVVWRFPTARDLRTGVHLNFNDDGFVAAGGRAIVANEEEAHTIVSINIKTHRRRHLFGRPGVRGGGAHLLNTPDDAYPLPNGEVAVADAYNCRVIWIHAHRIVRQLGETGVCAHDPPRTFGAINGDTPLRDGGMLISEINGPGSTKSVPAANCGGRCRLPCAIRPIRRCCRAGAFCSPTTALRGRS